MNAPMEEKEKVPAPAAPQEQSMDPTIEEEVAGKYLTFSLENKEYGIGILKVKEIIGMLPITAIPRTPDHVKGVINLRGKVIPIVDLRIKFGMPPQEYDERTCIIVVEINSKTGILLIGIVVDAVSEVLNINKEQIEPPPSFGSKMNINYIMGMAQVEKSVKILLNIDDVLNRNEIIQLESVA